jgi:hypothetical protein
MHGDFIDELLDALDRLAPLNHHPLKEVLILSGMPEKTQNLRYLAYNRQVLSRAGANLEFSAVAVINNRRIDQWRLQGWRKMASRWVFHPLWTRRNPMDLFLSRLRCDFLMMDLMAASKKDYTLFGILQVEQIRPRTVSRAIRPVVALPGLDATGIAALEQFETTHGLLV